MKLQLVIALSLFSLFHARGSPFINLDFEQVDTNKVGISQPNTSYLSGGGAVSNLMPGWSIEIPRGMPLTGVAFNVVLFEISFLSEPSFPALYSRDFLEKRTNYLTGNYAFNVQVTSRPLFLSQTADIPDQALGLKVFFAADVALNCQFCGNYLRSYVNGVEIREQAQPLPALGQAPSLYFDISAFAGLKAAKLEFQIGSFHTALIGDYPNVRIDRMEFEFPSPMPTTPRISQATITNNTNGFSFYWSADVATKYQVELSTNIPSVWQPIDSPITSTNGTFYFTDTSVTNQASGQRFYRLRTLP